MTEQTQRRPPRWLTQANRLNLALLSRGIGPSTQWVLTIPGRTSGLPRRTPIAVVPLAGSEYIVAGYPDADWVKNARAARRGVLTRGATSREVRLTELPAPERVAVLHEFLRTIRGGRSFLTVGPRAAESEVVAAAREHPVFRLD